MYAQLSTPLLWRFLQQMPAQGDDWAAQLLNRITEHCGRNAAGVVEDPADRRRRRRRCGPGLRAARHGSVTWCAVPRTGTAGSTWCPCSSSGTPSAVLAPDDDFLLRPDDEILLAGRSAERRALENTLLDDSARASTCCTVGAVELGMAATVPATPTATEVRGSLSPCGRRVRAAPGPAVSPDLGLRRDAIGLTDSTRRCRSNSSTETRRPEPVDPHHRRAAKTRSPLTVG